MEYLGEYLIPIAAIVLLLVVWYGQDVALVVGLVKRVFK